MMTASRTQRWPRLAAVSLLAVSLLAAASCSSTADDPASAQTEPRAAGSGAEPVDPAAETPATSVSTAGAAGADDTDGAAGADDPDGAAAAPLPPDTVEWAACDFEGIDCGTVSVPVDYRDPSAGSLSLEVAVHRATGPGERLGYLVVNPGGPGGSGVEMALGALMGPGLVFSAPVLERFDVVGFDPRGVGFSEPLFQCGEPGAQLAVLSRVEQPFDSEDEFAAGEAAVGMCTESMGAAAALLHSEYVARDIDEIRKALGAEQISYFGTSYGATLGVWYATLFGDAVRAMVVDGADNPLDDVSTPETRTANAIDELRQFEVLLGAALDACNTPQCPMHSDGDPRGYFADHVDALDRVVEVTGGNPTAGLLSVITPLYDQAEWPDLWAGFAALVEQGDPSILADFALRQLGDSAGGTTVTAHVNCLDSWVLHPQLDRSVRLADVAALRDAMRRELPLLAQIDAQPYDTCAFYDTLDIRPFDGALDGGEVPVIVIGNPLDPATPFSESQELVDETLANGYLVEAEHPAHVVYPKNECVNRLVHAALFDLELPADRHTVC